MDQFSSTGKTALITGASSGLGSEFAKIHASHGGNVILTARRKERLQSLAAELEAKHSIKATVIEADLSTPGYAKVLFESIQKNNLQVDILINNAGFGAQGKFAEIDIERQMRMIELNVRSLTELTRLCLPSMIEKKSGQILFISSTASFLPGPMQAVYFATKAFVSSLGQALSQELKGTGVSVTTFCPGLTETEFLKVSGLDKSRIAKGRKGDSAAAVATAGYQAMCQGDLITVFGGRNRFLVWLLKFVPKKVLLKSAAKAMEPV